MNEAPRLLLRRWVHVREEDEPGTAVYRPIDHPIPPARGRDGIEFLPDGASVYYDPGPADAPVGKTGTWTDEGDDRIRTEFSGTTTVYRIRELDEDVLRLSPER
ncbi:MAG: hypothetical protein ACRDXX_20755 [Stackebrandtia sp.]